MYLAKMPKTFYERKNFQIISKHTKKSKKK